MPNKAFRASSWLLTLGWSVSVSLLLFDRRRNGPGCRGSCGPALQPVRFAAQRGRARKKAGPDDRVVRGSRVFNAVLGLLAQLGCAASSTGAGHPGPVAHVPLRHSTAAKSARTWQFSWGCGQEAEPRHTTGSIRLASWTAWPDRRSPVKVACPCGGFKHKMDFERLQ